MAVNAEAIARGEKALKDVDRKANCGSGVGLFRVEIARIARTALGPE
jgi:hypothetical protein